MRMIALAAALAVAGGAARAAEIKPAFVYQMDAMFDRTFIDGLVGGAERFKRDTGIDYVAIAVTHIEQSEEAYRHLAERGADPIIGLGAAQADAIAHIAPEFPDTRWIVIDGAVKLPNVQSTLFDEREGSFLVGVAAAMASKSRKVGFIGGGDVPRVANFACGYEQGAKFADPKIDIVETLAGDTPLRGNGAAMAAKRQFEHGVDVVYAVAGPGNLGVYEAAASDAKLAIGVDGDRDYLHPGTMLTSMVKRVDIVVYDGLMAARNGTWKAGFARRGLKDGQVDWALDQYNETLITPAIRAKIVAAKAAIIAGRVKVAGSATDRMCGG
jgi:basic membrane protein A and related proteins